MNQIILIIIKIKDTEVFNTIKIFPPAEHIRG